MSTPTMKAVLSEHSIDEVYAKYLEMHQLHEEDPDPDKPFFPSKEHGRDRSFFARIAELINNGGPDEPYTAYAEIFTLSYPDWKAKKVQRRAESRLRLQEYFARQEQRT